MIERTTVRLPSALLDRARRKAAEEGRTLTALIEDGLRQVVADEGRGDRPARRLPRISEAGGGLMPGIDLTNLESIQEAEDVDYLRRLRSTG